ncbi:MAG: FKBP-type peptidyl-prolyl cis-trans isomerase [Fibrobacteria bacterium]|nr:FKBP-type peptidyl-prolyl cis-trans isomerase [Fibrobacteria bacterium]
MVSGCKTKNQAESSTPESNAASTESSSSSVDTKDTKQAFSYALGLDIASSLEKFKEDIDVDALTKALKDTLVLNTSAMPLEEAKKIREEKFKEIQERMMNKSIGEGKAFLEKNKTAEGVITTASGLQYIVLTEGSGPIPTTKDKVKVHYVGTLLDGREFDSSVKRGEPAQFPVMGVIPAWTEILQLMKTGSKYKIFAPSNLAYGERGAGRMIGPNETLIFEIELLEILK